MTWRLARSLETLRNQINALSPHRSKASDGTIGDKAHASRSSDHNPWVKDGGTGVVTALDVTHDPKAGVDIQKLADMLIASKDSRIKYIICNGRIVSGSGQKQPAWKWRKYSGSNAHTRNVHISVKSAKSAYDSTAAWKVSASDIAEVAPADSVLKKGSRGPFVAELQGNLNRLGYGPLRADGDFGAKTEAAVKAFQKKAGLSVDGWAGPRTIEAIGKAGAEKAAKPKIDRAEKTVPPTADTAVMQETSWFGKIMGWLTGGGVVGVGTVGQVLDADWMTVLAVAGGVVLIGAAGIGGFLLLGSRVAAKFDEINKRAG